MPATRLTMYPSRGGTAFVFLVTAPAFLALALGELVLSRRDGQLTALVAGLGAVAVVLACSAFFALGWHAWFRRIEFELDAQTLFVLQTGGFKRPVERRIPRAQVQGVLVESDDGTSSLTLDLGTEKLGLGDLASTDDYEKKVRLLRAFLGLSSAA